MNLYSRMCHLRHRATAVSGADMGEGGRKSHTHLQHAKLIQFNAFHVFISHAGLTCDECRNENEEFRCGIGRARDAGPSRCTGPHIFSPTFQRIPRDFSSSDAFRLPRFGRFESSLPTAIEPSIGPFSTSYPNRINEHAHRYSLHRRV